MDINPVIFLTSGGMAIVVSLVTVILVRLKFFSVGYMLLWLAVSACMVLLPFFYPLLRGASEILGFKTMTSMLFFGGIGLCLLVCIILSAQISKARIQLRQLAQLNAVMLALLDDKKTTRA